MRNHSGLALVAAGILMVLVLGVIGYFDSLGRFSSTISPSVSPAASSTSSPMPSPEEGCSCSGAALIHPSQPNPPTLFSILSSSPKRALEGPPGEREAQSDPSIPVRKVFRSLRVETPDVEKMLSRTPGELISLPLFDGKMATVQVVLVRAATGQEPAAIAGAVQTPFIGSFALVADPRLGWRGSIVPQSGELAYEFETGEHGELFLDEVSRGAVVCSPMPPHPKFIPARKGSKAISTTAVKGAGVASDVPVLRSRSGAKGVLYLDFDGATVTDPFWNNGATIQAEPSGLSNDKMTEIWKIMSEDFLPFDVNVTTVEADYNNARLGMRMRCIFTPTTDAMPGSGGVAYLGSFKWSGTTPCWAFNGTGTSATQSWAAHVGAMTGSHELGHTFNLLHDGDTSQTGVYGAYYAGHGTGATSWGPIMGAPFSATVIQWSKGEYKVANNTEDDVAIISGSYFGVGYISDDYADSIAQAGIIPQSSKGVVSVAGLLSKAGDRDVFRLDCGKGSVTINATGAAVEPNLDIKLELINSSGTVVKLEDPTGSQAATLSASIPSQGTYYLRVSPSAEPDGSSTGWTTYGSVGAYALTGTFPSMIGFADNFAEAASLPTSFTFSGIEASNTSATAQAEEPAHDGLAARRSLWWKWSPGVVGRMKISTQGSDFDTVLAVYAGNSLSGLQRVTANDNVHPQLRYSEVSFPVARDATYYIAVDGKNGATGKIFLSGSGSFGTAPENDSLLSATALSGSFAKIRGSTFNATREDGEPQHRAPGSAGTYTGFCSVWYQWKAPSSGTYIISTEGSTFDTLLGTYTGPVTGDLIPSSLVRVVGKDTTPKGVLWNRIKFSATSGTTYYVAIDGFGRVGGNFVLTIQPQ